MGNKKSVVFMIFLTIVIAVLCAITAFPAFTVPGTVKKWNPAVLQYDLGADLGGGYYAYYYPEGVIPEAEYNSNLAELTEAVETAEAADKQKAEDEKKEYEESYLKIAGSSLCFSKDEKLDIVANDQLTDSFKTAFEEAAAEIAARFERKAYSNYRVSVVDGYALRVELPKSEDTEKTSLLLTSFAQTGKMTLEKGGELVEELKASDADISDLIDGMSVKTMNVGKVAYLEIRFTKAGREMLKSIKGELSSSTEAESSTDSSSIVSLDVKIGDEKIVSIYSDSIMDNNTVRVFPVDGMNKDYVETIKIMMESVIDKGEFDINFEISSVRTFDPVYGDNALTLLYIALAIAIAAILVLPIVKMGRFGGVSTYTTLSYFIITALCFSFITSGTFEITLGSILVFLAGMVLVNVMQYYIYGAIKTEFNLGKTVDSSVKGGYKKTLWTVVDVYVVLLLGALALLIGASGLHTLALQALICVITGAFCNLLWARFINYTYLSASKNKYKYFRFVREDDDDDE